MAQTNAERILDYLTDEEAATKDDGRTVKEIMDALTMDVENVRFGLIAMLKEGTAETSNTGSIQTGVPAAFRPMVKEREDWRRDHIEPVSVWLGPKAKAAIAEKSQAGRTGSQPSHHCRSCSTRHNGTEALR